MGTCSVCYAWKPKKWEGWHFVDQTAECSICGEHTERTGCCDDFSIVKPLVVAKRHTAARSSTEDELSAWYETNKIEYEPVAGGEEAKLYKHQQEDVDRYSASTVIPLFGEMGCLDGNTLVKYFTRPYGASKRHAPPVTLKYLYEKMLTDSEHEYWTRGFDNGAVDVKIERIVKKPVQHCLTLSTVGGRFLTLTDDHEILTPQGYRRADECCVGTQVLIAQYQTRPPQRVNSVRGDYTHLLEDREVIDKDGYVLMLGPQTFGMRRYRGGIRKHIFLMEQQLGRALLPNERVHHIDGNKLNNDIRNLQLLCPNEHARMHATARYFPVGDVIADVADAGIRDTFDVICAAPHNFVANGIIVHNCGKSAVAIRIAGEKYLRGEIDSMLVVAPNGVHKQWAKEEIPKWLQPEVPRQVQCYGGRGGAKYTHPFSDEKCLQIVCVNIDTFSTPRKWMEIAEWALATKCFVVLDEATCIKSIKSKRTQRMLYEFNEVRRRGKVILSSKVRTEARAILTGTPVTNGPMDLWAMFEFLKPNFFNRNWYSFNNYYAMHHCINITTVDEKGVEHHRSQPVMLDKEHWSKIKDMYDFGLANAVFGITADTFNTIHSQDSYEGPYKHADELQARLREVASFRLLKDCVDMPPQNYTRRIIQMNDEIAQCYYDMESELLAEYEEHLTTARNKITAIIRLQQISSGFIVSYEQDKDAPPWSEETDFVSKEVTWIGSDNPKLVALYNDIDESAKPVIVVTHFTAEAERIYEDLRKRYSCCLMTGWKKVGTMEEFKEGKYDVCVANIRVISRGFNMQNSHTMFFYSNTFSLEDRLQVEGRIWRIGQSAPCQYIDYVYEDTIDMKVVGALRQKRSLLDYIRGVSTRSFLTEQDEVFKVEYDGLY